MLRRRMMMGQGDNIDYSQMYLTFQALESGTFSVSDIPGNSRYYYSLNGGSTWSALAAGNSTPTVAAGNEICWKVSGLTPTSSAGIGAFSASGLYKAYGNIMSLVYSDNFIGQTALLNSNQFRGLFVYNSNLIDIKGLVMPATSLTERCYFCMFQESGITSAPYGLLPATTLSSQAYGYMFAEASSLTNAPDLPASSLTYQSYVGMFRNTSVNYVKCLATSMNGTDGGSTYVWLRNVPSTGTFVKDRRSTIWGTGENYIPSGWTVESV